ncbi:amidohydrolase family protein [Niallia sp. Krafla_26]|uniref:amidohydrolase family protein n=1 Tax=Niallia sp. Krafla_26 TaxID=3064703 RepID=UPI003D171036
MTSTLFYNGTIITCNEEREVFKNGAIVIENGLITYVGETPTDKDEYHETINLNGDLLLPGLINTHGHVQMSLLRGYGDDLPLKMWLEEKIWPIEAKFNPEIAKWGSYLSLVEMIRTGTTTFVDMYDHMDEVAQAVEQTGIRGKLCRGIVALGSEEEKKLKLEEATRFAKDWNGKADGRITTMMSPHAPYTCDPDFIAKIVDKSIELDVPIHIHMSETIQEVEQNVEQYGNRPVKHLEEIGVFDRPTLVAHAVHVNDEEIDILARHDVKVSHNIISNLKLGSGIAPIRKMLDSGITVSLGTDSSASNNNLDLFEELKQVAILHKGIELDATLIHAETALQMATKYGAQALWLEDKVGSLEVGKEADFIVIDTNSPFYQPSSHNPISHLVYSGSGRDVKDVYVQGKPIMKDRQLLTIDEERVYYEVNRVMKLLLNE